MSMSKVDQVKAMLCPTTPLIAKLVIAIMFKARNNIDNGDHSSNLTFPTHITTILALCFHKYF